MPTLDSEVAQRTSDFLFVPDHVTLQNRYLNLFKTFSPSVDGPLHNLLSAEESRILFYNGSEIRTVNCFKKINFSFVKLRAMQTITSLLEIQKHYLE